MHNAALRALCERDARLIGWEYFSFDIEPADLERALGLMAERNFLGVNLTVPHKVLALPLVAEADPQASMAGAVNTLKAKGGSWSGFNTDGYGLIASLAEDLGLSLRGVPVVLLGAGGAARGAAFACLREGCSGLWILNRSAQRLEELAAALRSLGGSAPVRGCSHEGELKDVPEGAVVINATSLGLKPSDPRPADLSRMKGVRAVYDMVYNPPETALLAQARALALPCANGLGMLVHQGAKALEIWTGHGAAATAPLMRQAATKALGYKG